jgi:hypothetical protein
MEYWNAGMLEYRDIERSHYREGRAPGRRSLGVGGSARQRHADASPPKKSRYSSFPIIPTFHYSNIPVLLQTRFSLRTKAHFPEHETITLFHERIFCVSKGKMQSFLHEERIAASIISMLSPIISPCDQQPTKGRSSHETTALE